MRLVSQGCGVWWILEGRFSHVFGSCVEVETKERMHKEIRIAVVVERLPIKREIFLKREKRVYRFPHPLENVSFRYRYLFEKPLSSVEHSIPAICAGI